MLVYESVKKEFMECVVNDCIVDKINNVFQRRFGRASESEKRAWKNSLEYMFKVLSTDEIPGRWKLLPYIILPTSYILIRLIFYFYPADFDKTASVLIMIFSTIAVTFLLLYYKTNKFKTKTKMEQMKVEDGPRRIIKK